MPDTTDPGGFESFDVVARGSEVPAGAGGFVVPSGDGEALDPAKFDVVARDPLTSRSVAELTGDPAFSPQAYFNQHADSLSPQQVDKLAEVLAARENAPSTVREDLEALGRGGWAGIKGALASLWPVAKTLTKTAIALTPGAMIKDPQGAAKATTEVAASAESATQGNIDILRGAQEGQEDFLRRRVAPWLSRITDPVGTAAREAEAQKTGAKLTDLTTEQARERLFLHKATDELLKETRNGEGPISGEIKAAFEKAGLEVDVDPKAVEDLEWVTDWMNVVPGWRGFGAASRAGSVPFRAASKGALRKGVEVAAEVVGRRLERAGNALVAAADASGKASVRGAMAGAAVDLAIGGGGVIGAISGGAAAKRVGRAGGLAASALGRTLASGEVPGVIKAATDIPAGVARGFAEGLNPLAGPEAALYLGSAGLMAAGGNPEEAGQVAGNAAAFAGLGGGLAGAKTAAGRAVGAAVIAGFKANENVLPDLPTTDIGTDPALDAANAEQVEQIRKVNPQAANRYNFWRDTFRAAGVEMYVTDTPTFRDRVSAATGGTVAPEAAEGALGFFDEANKRVYLNGSLTAKGHELSHALHLLMPSDVRRRFETALDQAMGPEQYAEFAKHYDASLGVKPGEPGSIAGDMKRIREEAGAEMLSLVIQGEDPRGLAPAPSQVALEWLGALGEKFGLWNPQLGGNGASPLGVQPSANAVAPVREFLRGVFLPIEGNRAREAGTATPGAPPVLPTPIPPVIPPGGPGGPPPAPPAGPTPPPPPAPAPAVPAPPASPATPPPASPAGPRPTTAGLFPPATPAVQAPGHAEAAAVVATTPALQPQFDALTAAMGNGQAATTPVHIEYAGVKPGAPTPGLSPAQQRAVDQADAYVRESLGALPADVRAIFEKVTVPYRWIVRGKNVNVQAMSPDKVVANTRRIAERAAGAKASDLVPYPVNTAGVITDAGWRQLAADLVAYTGNQANGFGGDGSAVTVPAGYKGYIGTPTPGFVPTAIPKPRADFLNLAMALPPPGSSKTPGGYAGRPVAEYPNVQAALLATANKRPVVPARTAKPGANTYTKGGVNAAIMETNPLRDAFAARGVDFTGRELYQVTEELNLDGITKVTPVPTSGFRAPRTDLIRGGFMPAPEEQTPAGYRDSGLAFKNFFSDVTRGADKYRPKAPWKSILPLDEQSAFIEEYDKHTGNFDAHIATSIPAFKDVQVRVGSAVAKTAKGPVLDVGASEGSWLKAVVAQSDGRLAGVALDPNPDMAEFFRTKSTVPGAVYSEDAFQRGFEDGGRVYSAHDPKTPYDVVHESMVFQFISPDRAGQVAEAKRLMAPDGLFLTEEKVLSEDPEVWKANEDKKDRNWKDNFYSAAELKAKQQVVRFSQDPTESKAVGMVDNMVTGPALESVLQSNFKHVAQYWDSGNFRGYAASDDPARLREFLSEVGDTSTDFSTAPTPRAVGDGAFMPAPAKEFKEGDAIPSWTSPGMKVLAPERPTLRTARDARTDAGRIVEARGFQWTMDPGAGGGRSFDINLIDSDGIAVGGIGITVNEKSPVTGRPIGYVESSWVDSPLRGLGIGEAIYREAATKLQELGIDELNGTVLGFGAMGVRRKLFGDTPVRMRRAYTRSRPDSDGGPKTLTEALADMETSKGDSGWYSNKSYDVTSRIDPKARFMPAPPVDSLEFKRWFGGSQVVNPDGSPRVLYHGTRTPVTRVEKSREGSGSTIFGNYTVPRWGFFAAEEQEVAKQFAVANGGRSGVVQELFFRVEAPLDTIRRQYPDGLFNSIEQWGDSHGFKGFNMARTLGDHWGRGTLWELFDADSLNDPELWISMFKDLGYDGLRMSEPGADGGDPGIAWVAFDPGQVKSATDNSGAFDDANPDIRFMPTPAAQATKWDTSKHVKASGTKSREWKTGEPVVIEMYHGTKRPAQLRRSGRFDSSRMGETYGETNDELGWYFTNNGATAADEAYTGSRGGVVPFLVRLDNPLVTADDIVGRSKSYIDALEQQRLDGGHDGIIVALDDQSGGNAVRALFRERLRKEYDRVFPKLEAQWKGASDTRKIQLEELDGMFTEAAAEGVPPGRPFLDWARSVVSGSFPDSMLEFKPIQGAVSGEVWAVVPPDVADTQVKLNEPTFDSLGRPIPEEQRMTDRPDFRFMPPTMAEMERAWERREKRKTKLAPVSTRSDALTGWVLPSGEFVGPKGTEAGSGDWHGQWLTDNAGMLAERFGFKTEGGVAERDPAIKAGLVRVRYTPKDGTLTVEASKKGWNKSAKAAVLDLILSAPEKIDRLRFNVQSPDGSWKSGDSGIMLDESPGEKASIARQIWMPRPKSRVDVAIGKSARGTKVAPELYDSVTALGAMELESDEMGEYLTKITDAVTKIPGMNVPGSTWQEKLPALVERIADNIEFVYRQVPPALQAKWREWYNLAHDMADRWGGEFSHSADAVSAVNAALSPQKNWYENVTMTRRILETVRDNPKWSEAHRDFTEVVIRKQDGATPASVERDLRELYSVPVGRRLSALSPEHAAWLLRAQNELFGDTKIYDHNLEPAPGFKDGGRLRWGSYVNVAAAMRILRNPTAATISEEVGQAHKVRNFYNNHVDPNNPTDVTMDTHAVGVGILDVVSGAHPAVVDSLSGPKHAASGYVGTYPIYADAYRVAAARLGVLPREVQSVTWEAIREQIPWEVKRSAKVWLPATVAAIHTAADTGNIEYADARRLVWEAFNVAAKAKGGKAGASAELQKYIPDSDPGQYKLNLF